MLYKHLKTPDSNKTHIPAASKVKLETEIWEATKNTAKSTPFQS